MIQNVSPECLKAFAQGWLWLDFISVPQVTVSPEDRLFQTKAEQVDAIMSLHTYVGHSSCFIILAPMQHHHESNEFLSFSSWRNRGWCQFELATAMLLGTKPVLLISSKGAVMHLFHRVFCQLAPCLAQFTVEEDRQHIAQTLREVAQFKVSELQKAGDHHGQQLLQATLVRLLQHATESRHPQYSLSRLSETSEALTRSRSWRCWKSYNGWTDLHVAVSRSSVVLVDHLLKGNANPNARTFRAEPEYFLRASLSPLHIWSLFSTRAEIAELLVAANGDVNAKAENAWTPLMLCCETANEVGLRILLKLNADPNSLTYVGVTPLCIAISHDSHRLVAPLLQHRADAKLCFFHGFTLLHLLAVTSNGESTQLLLQQGLNINQQGYVSPFSCESIGKLGMWHFLLKHGNRHLLHEGRLMQGATPLLCAAARGNVAAFQELLAAKADVNIPNAHGQSAYNICKDTMPDEILSCINGPIPSQALTKHQPKMSSATPTRCVTCFCRACAIQ